VRAPRGYSRAEDAANALPDHEIEQLEKSTLVHIRKRLQFEPDERQIEVLRSEAGNSELHKAMGEVDDRSGDGGTSGAIREGVHGAGGL
jgi:hypothetical protein